MVKVKQIKQHRGYVAHLLVHQGYDSLLTIYRESDHNLVKEYRVKIISADEYRLLMMRGIEIAIVDTEEKLGEVAIDYYIDRRLPQFDYRPYGGARARGKNRKVYPVQQWRERLNNGESITSLAASVGLSRKRVYEILKRESVQE